VQDAERCIAAVDGSENGGRTLRWVGLVRVEINISLTNRFSGPNSVRPNTAPPISETRHVRTRAACFFMSLEKRRTASPVKTSPPSTSSPLNVPPPPTHHHPQGQAVRRTIRFPSHNHLLRARTPLRPQHLPWVAR
jgi:hypothetical protein